ncbi:MAG: reverse transcriptase family protein, partial [Candidatus Thioglobus sp.]
VTEICNLSIRLSTFPDKCKIAKLKPLFKKGSKTEAKNYRPISLLPLISKIVEKVIYDQTQNFLDKNEILYKYQSGFRSNHSTNSCLSYLSNKVLTSFDQGMLTGMILIDLQKAFDTIDHEILLQKMKYLGFSAATIKWFESYLENRIFKVNVGDEYSNPGDLSCGVPQGSILGPLLFLLYVNDMPLSVSCDLLLYADDSCLVYTGKDVDEIETQLNNDFNSICDWFVDNKLSIHFGEDKTKSIIFGSKQKLRSLKELDIRRGNVKIKQHSEVTYLGCVLDGALSGEAMATHALGKINGKLKFLYRNQNYLCYSLRRLLCNALIQPHFDFACLAWYPNLTKKIKMKLQCA